MEKRNIIQYSSGVLAGSCFLAVVQLMGLPKLSPTQEMAMIAFLLSMPLNVLIFLLPVHMPDGEHFKKTELVYWMVQWIAFYLSVGGLAVSLGHFGWGYGALFITACIGSLGLFHWFQVQMGKAQSVNKDRSSKLAEVGTERTSNPAGS